MARAERRFGVLGAVLVTCVCGLLACAGAPEGKVAPSPPGTAACDSAIAFSDVQTVVARRCTSCHSATGAAGPDYDWTNDRSLRAHRSNVAAQVAQGSMPPVGPPRLSPEDRRTLVCWGEGRNP